MRLNDADVQWLAGLLEGEGHFRLHVTRASGAGSPKIDLKMCDKDVIERAAKVMTAIADSPCIMKQVAVNAYQIQVYGNRARAIMWAIVRLMGNRRRKQIWQALNHYSPNRR